MAETEYRKSRLNGPAGLIVAIIAQAADDLQGEYGRELQLTAHLYFQGSLYRHHLESIGLEPDNYPMGLRPAPSDKEYARAVTRAGKRSHLFHYLNATKEGRAFIERAWELKRRQADWHNDGNRARLSVAAKGGD